MKQPQISIGSQSFAEIRRNQQLYVDKTRFVEEFLDDQSGTSSDNAASSFVSLLTRPRRFGKSTLLSMLKSFFSIEERDSRELFAGLYISKRPDLCAAWQQRFPVLLLNFNGVGGYDVRSQLNDLRKAFKRCADSSLLYLLDSPKVAPWHKNYLRQLLNNELPEELLADFLDVVLKALSAHWKRKVILLVDEYDAPLLDAFVNGFFKQAAAFYSSFYQTLKADDSELKFALFSGALRIAKESIFTGFNNFSCLSMAGTKYGDCCGFTEEEVGALLKMYGLEHCQAELKHWYDGYTMAGVHNLYSPWDIVNYLRDRKNSADYAPKRYWMNSSSNSFIVDFLHRFGSQITEQMEQLLAGKSISARLSEADVFDTLFADLNNFWNYLYCGGYLTSDNTNVDEGSLFELKIPNYEVKSYFVEKLPQLMADQLRTADLNGLYQAFADADGRAAARQLSILLADIISYSYLCS